MELETLVAPSAACDLRTPSETGPFVLVPEPLRPALEARGFEALTAVQRAVLEADVTGRDLQISSQTGSGKTVALGFVLATHLQPTEHGPAALIIVPTRELATQVSGELQWLLAKLQDVDVAVVTGGSPLFRERQMLKRKPRVLVGTPGRLLDHIRNGVLDLADVRELVLDEADQMLDMGFREDLEAILDATAKTRRTHLVSATFPAGIQRLAANYQRDPIAIEGTQLGSANADIDHQGHLVRQNDRYAALVNILLLAGGEKTLVFVERRSDTAEVATKLEADGFTALPLSGELAQSQRARTLEAFRTGRATVLVATDVAARGLDIPDVTTVIQTSPPLDAEVYTHRSGRTGRAGKRGRCVLLSPPNRRYRVNRLLDQAGVDLKWGSVPGADEVRKELDQRRRTALVTDLEATLAEAPRPAHVAQAQELLEEHDPSLVVAALLARLEPKDAPQPREVTALNSKSADRRGPRDNQSDGRSNYRERPQRGQRSFQRGGKAPHNGPNSGSVRFFVNWGRNQGADPRRLLAALCRRGQVQGSDIGSIAIHPNASTFDVAADIAEAFERNASRPDKRDRRTHIRRDRGPVQGSRQRRP